jgi:hypothetical protein
LVVLTAIVFEGGPYTGPVETWVARVREEMTIALLARLSASGNFDPVVLCTDRPHLGRRAEQETGAISEVSDASSGFHFGRRLQEAVHTHAPRGFIYLSGGSGQLMTAAEVQSFAQAIHDNPESMVANNIYSADMFGTLNVRAVLDPSLPDQDNSVPMVVAAESGVHLVPLAPTLGTGFDVDTPTDVLILSEFPKLDPRIRAAAAWEPACLARDRLKRAQAILAGELTEIALIGRVPPSTVAALNEQTRCRLRVFSEERGMRSFGRDRPGIARSLIGRFVEAAGAREFFGHLSWCAQAVFIDTRVIFAHMGAVLGQEERFASDLFMDERIGDRGAAEFVREAREAEIPVILGGHSLVSAGVRVVAGLAGMRAAW